MFFIYAFEFPECNSGKIINLLIRGKIVLIVVSWRKAITQSWNSYG